MQLVHMHSERAHLYEKSNKLSSKCDSDGMQAAHRGRNMTKALATYEGGGGGGGVGMQEHMLHRGLQCIYQH